MTRYAAVDAAAIDEVVMAGDAIDRAVFLVREIDQQRLRSRRQSFERQLRAALILLRGKAQACKRRQSESDGNRFPISTERKTPIRWMATLRYSLQRQ